jgi:hypothetical protein
MEWWSDGENRGQMADDRGQRKQVLGTRFWVVGFELSC